MSYLHPITLLIDLDGPFAAFDEAFWALCAEHGIEMDCTLEQQRHRFGTDHIPDKAARQRARDLVNTSGWFRDLPVVDGAVHDTLELAEFCDVWLCTKPLEDNPTCRDEKAAWVVEHLGDEWKRKLIIAPDKSMVRGTTLLDDAPAIEWLDRALWNPIIFKMPWNGHGSKWQGLPRWTWGEPYANLLHRVGWIGDSSGTLTCSCGWEKFVYQNRIDEAVAEHKAEAIPEQFQRAA